MSMRHLLLFALAAGGLLGSLDASAQKLYRWVDEDGTVRYSDQVPPEAIDKQRDTLNQRGMTVDRVDRAMTAEERAARDLAVAEAQRLELARVEQAKQDAILLGSYQSEDDLERSYRERFALVEQTLESANIGIRSQERSLADLLAHAAGLERNGKPVDAKLAESITTARKQVLQQHEYLQRREAERDALQQEYDSTLSRYRELRADRAVAAD